MENGSFFGFFFVEWNQSELDCIQIKPQMNKILIANYIFCGNSNIWHYNSFSFKIDKNQETDKIPQKNIK